MTSVERFEDMSPRGKLQLLQQEDGDIIVGVVPSDLETFRRNGLIQTAEFCTIGMGGGQSPKTLAALRALMKAMEEDNKERPQHRQ